MHDYARNSKQLFWNRKMIEMFIDLYKENRCLYDKCHQDYNNNTVKTNVLENMLSTMRTFLPTLELDDIQDKIKVIRAQFSEEVAFAEAAGAGYVPKLWCFEKLKFLREHLTCWPTDSDEENAHREESQSVNNDDGDVGDCGDDGDDGDDSDDSHIYLTTMLEKYRNSQTYRWDNVVTKILIHTLEGYPVLFDPKHNDFKYRTPRRKALIKLHKEMKQVDPKINIKHLYDKIAQLRSCYLKELNRLKKRQTNNGKVTSKWWCFDMLGKLYKNRYIKNFNSNLEKEAVENDTQTNNNNNNSISSTHQEVETFNDDQQTNNNELMEFEEIQVFNTDQEMQTVLIMDTLNNENIMEYECVSTTMGNDDTKDIQPPITNSINQEYCDTNEETDFNVTEISAVNNCSTNVISHETEFKIKKISDINNCSPKTKKRKKTINMESDIKYKSLGDLVKTKLKEISPIYHADFAWDVQCLVRKYVMKSRAGEVSASSATVNNESEISKSINRDIILPRSGNVALNLSFV